MLRRFNVSKNHKNVKIENAERPRVKIRVRKQKVVKIIDIKITLMCVIIYKTIIDSKINVS